MMSKTAFVTGSTGFVGMNLIDELTRQGWRVIAFHRPDSNLRFLNRFPVEHALGDVVDSTSIFDGLPNDVDTVFHVAGSSNMWSRHNPEQTLVNVDGTRHVANAALKRGARKMVFCSSWVSYGVHPERFDESAAQLGGASWVNHFRSKFLAEQEVRAVIAEGLNASIINPSLILGPYDTTGWARFIQLVQLHNLRGIPPGIVNFCDAREVAKAHIAAASNGICGQNYLLGGPDTSFLHLVQTIGVVTGHSVPKRTTPYWVLRALGYAQTRLSTLTNKAPTLTPELAYSVSRHMSCDYSRAERELGYGATDLSTMVEASYDWLRVEKLLAGTG
jgi:dihydroflavonol-4-reductase